MIKMSKFVAELKKRNNGTFWITSVSQLLLAAQIILAVFGKQDLLNQVLHDKILAVAEGVITVLGTIGVFTNPITKVVPDAPVEPVVAPVEPVVAPVEPEQPQK